MPPASLRRAWQIKPWIRRLSGLTLELSTANRGVAAWISSLQDIRASHSPSPDAKKQNTIPGISGRTFVRSSPTSGQGSLFSRTYPTIYDWDSNRSTMTFEEWVTALRRVCLRRKKSVLRISVNDYSYWPTPRAQEPGSTSSTHGRGLAETARHWLTPRAAETGERQETFLKRQGDRTNKAHGSLTSQARTWPTPMSRDWKDSPGMKERDTKQVSLANLAFRSGLPLQATQTHGDPSQMRLNPLFTEWLMGWPTGWTDFGSVATALSLWQRRMRSSLWQLLSKIEQ